MNDEVEKLNSIFPKGFFQKPRKHVTKKSSKEDTIPFDWEENILNNKTTVIITKGNKNN